MKVDIKVKVSGVYELEAPNIDNEFAKSVGQADLNALREMLKHNLEHEAEHDCAW